MIARRLQLLRTALAGEQGFTMVTVLGVMFVVMLGSAAAIAAATNDLGGGARDKATKQALSAAEAGVNDYSYHLTLNNNYWALCTGVPAPAVVNQAEPGDDAVAQPARHERPVRHRAVARQRSARLQHQRRLRHHDRLQHGDVPDPVHRAGARRARTRPGTRSTPPARW